MRVRNKKRFIVFVIIVLLILAALIFGGVKLAQGILGRTDADITAEDDPNILRVKDVISPEILALINGNEWGITSDMIENHPMPEADQFEINLKEEFSVPDGTFEKQEANECSGFAAAYVLRAMGKNVTGKGVYYSMPNDAMPNGYRLPVDIVAKLSQEGVRAGIYTGTASTLKSRLADTKMPVIVLIGDSLNWQHYITFVGYNDVLGEMYFYDSEVEGDANSDRPGNKTMSKTEFLKVWANGLPAFNNLYIAIK